MALEPIQLLFLRERGGQPEAGVRYLAQDFLRQRLKSEAVYCDSADKGVLVVRVGSPGLQQAAKLLEWDLARQLQETAQYRLEKLQVKTEV